FPLLAHDNPLRRLFSPPEKLTGPYVAKGLVVADLGCGPGFYTLALAEGVGPEGKVYAVDIQERSIRKLEKKAAKRGFHNIEAHASSATDLGFIKDGSVDFILAHGLLCSMAPHHHDPAVAEMLRILKPQGRAYLSAAKGSWSYVDRAEWERILGRFSVEKNGEGGDFWGVVSPK
ncbi:MAG: class I SAM-dependent methyltransferase, partial [Candidatus Aminicenantes bacterium]|nr:class I SAM-dependent methyltransferase [Candidatus Aminicenantes bacterium]